MRYFQNALAGAPRPPKSMKCVLLYKPSRIQRILLRLQYMNKHLNVKNCISAQFFFLAVRNLHCVGEMFAVGPSPIPHPTSFVELMLWHMCDRI